MEKQETKFCYAHFPIGTIFEVSGMIAALNDGVSQNEVKAIYRNGPNSYVLETTRQKEWRVPVYDSNGGAIGDKIESTPITINIDHVTKIIKRGNGPVRVQLAGAEYRQPGRETGIHKGKGSYVCWYGLSEAIANIADKYLPVDACIDMDELRSYIHEHAAIRVVTIDHGEYHSHRYFVRKKKLDRVIRQNVNRFLLSPKLVQAEYDREVGEMMDEDMDACDRSYTELCPVFDGEPDARPAEGSCYDDDDFGSRLDPAIWDDLDDSPALDEQFALKTNETDDQDFLNIGKVGSEETHV